MGLSFSFFQTISHHFLKKQILHSFFCNKFIKKQKWKNNFTYKFLYFLDASVLNEACLVINNSIWWKQCLLPKPNFEDYISFNRKGNSVFSWQKIPLFPLFVCLFLFLKISICSHKVGPDIDFFKHKLKPEYYIFFSFYPFIIK